ncbi:MAG TPA: hypothetical protein VIJ34_02615 [Acidimicrobiales bacterium]
MLPPLAPDRYLAVDPGVLVAQAFEGAPDRVALLRWCPALDQDRVDDVHEGLSLDFGRTHLAPRLKPNGWGNLRASCLCRRFIDV